MANPHKGGGHMERNQESEFCIEMEGCTITLHFEDAAEGNSLIELLGSYYEQLVYEELQKG